VKKRIERICHHGSDERNNSTTTECSKQLEEERKERGLECQVLSEEKMG
jgi:hypothetical protein